MRQESSDLAGFHGGVAAGELRVPRCSGCERAHWPPRPACPHCLGRDLDWVRPPAVGRLFTWTVVGHTRQPESREHVPYPVGMIAFPELGIRMIGRLDIDLAELDFDLPVRWSPAANPDGLIWRSAEPNGTDQS